MTARVQHHCQKLKAMMELANDEHQFLIAQASEQNRQTDVL
jgi:hypothetical protein